MDGGRPRPDEASLRRGRWSGKGLEGPSPLDSHVITSRSGPVSRVLSPCPRARGATISLGRRLPAASSSRPGSGCGTGRPAPILRSRGNVDRSASCLALLPMGFAEPDRSPGLLVSSYLTVSPLPPEREPRRRFAFCGTFPDLAAGGRYPPSWLVEPGLSSRRPPPPDRIVRGGVDRRSPGPLRGVMTHRPIECSNAMTAATRTGRTFGLTAGIRAKTAAA